MNDHIDPSFVGGELMLVFSEGYVWWHIVDAADVAAGSVPMWPGGWGLLGTVDLPIIEDLIKAKVEKS